MKYQEDEIKAYCKEQGLTLIHMFRDEGISGAKLNEEALEIDRVGLQEMLAHLSSVQIDYLVVLNTSRLWRLDIVKVLIQRELKEYGCDIKSIEQLFYSNLHDLRGLRLFTLGLVGKARNKKKQTGKSCAERFVL